MNRIRSCITICNELTTFSSAALKLIFFLKRKNDKKIRMQTIIVFLDTGFIASKPLKRLKLFRNCSGMAANCSLESEQKFSRWASSLKKPSAHWDSQTMKYTVGLQTPSKFNSKFILFHSVFTLTRTRILTRESKRGFERETKRELVQMRSMAFNCELHSVFCVLVFLSFFFWNPTGDLKLRFSNLLLT